MNKTHHTEIVLPEDTSMVVGENGDSAVRVVPAVQNALYEYFVKLSNDDIVSTFKRTSAELPARSETEAEYMANIVELFFLDAIKPSRIVEIDEEVEL